MQRLKLEQRDRGSYIGSSDVAAVLGIPGAYGTAWDVWARRQPEMAGDDGDNGDNAMFEAGHRFESSVRDWTAKLLGASEVVPGEDYHGAVVVGPHPWACTHPDGYLLLPSGWHVYEGKLAEGSRHKFGAAGEMPDHYLVQWVWHQLCCGLPGAFGAQLSLREAPWVHTMERNKVLEDGILNLVGEWWRRHIEGGEPAALDGSTAVHTYLQRKHANHSDTLREAAEAEESLVMELAEARKLMKALEGDAKRLEAEIKAAIGDDLGLRTASGARVTWKSQAGARRIDTTRLRADHPALAEEYTVEGEPQRVLRSNPTWTGL